MQAHVPQGTYKMPYKHDYRTPEEQKELEKAWKSQQTKQNPFKTTIPTEKHINSGNKEK